MQVIKTPNKVALKQSEDDRRWRILMEVFSWSDFLGFQVRRKDRTNLEPLLCESCLRKLNKYPFQTFKATLFHKKIDRDFRFCNR